MKKKSDAPTSTSRSSRFSADARIGDGTAKVLLETMGFNTPAEGVAAMAKELSSKGVMPTVIKKCEEYAAIQTVLLAIKSTADDFFTQSATPDAKQKTAQSFNKFADQLLTMSKDNEPLENVLSTTLITIRRFDKFSKIRETSTDVSPSL